MLQTVLGLEVARIAPAFLTSPATLAQRLVRAKTKIRVAGIPFEIPCAEERPERLCFVLDAIYAAYNSGWEDALATDDLAEEAIRLARVLVHLMPHEPEALGLLALLLHCQARRPARLDPSGRYIPLNEQNPTMWNPDLIKEAETVLRQAVQRQAPGRFQIEAAIQSVHAQRARTGQIHWSAISHLYEALLQLTPALGARIGHAIALAEATHPSAGLAALESLPLESLQSHQPYWAARAYLLRALGENEPAREAYVRAIGLSPNPAVRVYLQQCREALV
jgi:RNA polymerase sigma-70 factor (ECF subfamily)